MPAPTDPHDGEPRASVDTTRRRSGAPTDAESIAGPSGTRPEPNLLGVRAPVRRRERHRILSLAAAGMGLLLAACSPATTGRSGAEPASATGGASPTATARLFPAMGTGSLPLGVNQALQRALDRSRSIAGLQGLTAAVVSADGVWSGSSGKDGSGDPLAPDSAMWIASITKTFTAAEILLLSERGRIDLDAPISRYVKVPFDTRGATVRQVLSMRGGFPDMPCWGLAVKDLQHPWTIAAALAAIPRTAPRVGTLGGSPSYNGTQFMVLDQVISTLTGEPTAVVFHRDLIDPAGLRRTWVQPADIPQPPLARGTDPEGTVMVAPTAAFLPSLAVPSCLGAAGNVAADSTDVARWGYLLYGGYVIDPTLVRQLYADPLYDVGLGSEYALGTMVRTSAEGTMIVGHVGGGATWPYAAALQVWTGSHPVSVSILSSQPIETVTLRGIAERLRDCV